jgi:hypothetical protein
MPNQDSPSPFEIVRAVETLRAAGYMFSPPQNVATRFRLYTLAEAAELTGMDLTWLRRHQDEFPNALKPPDSPRRLRECDIEAAYKRWMAEPRV